jgi:hypothetical protein
MYAVRTAAVDVFKPGPFCKYQEIKKNYTLPGMFDSGMAVKQGTG